MLDGVGLVRQRDVDGAEGVQDASSFSKAMRDTTGPVSYTHLTLPTKRIV